MKKLFFSLCCFAAAALCKGQTINYTVLNKNHDLAPVKGAISFLSFDGALTYPLTAGILVQGCIKDKLFYTATLRQGYGKMHKNEVGTTQKISRSTLLEGGVDFVLTDKDKTSSLRIVTNSTGYSETSFRAVLDKRVNWAASGGVIFRQHPKYVDHAGYIKSGDKTLTPAEGQYYHFNSTTSALYLGFSHRSIRKVKVSAEGWAYRRCIINKFFIHGMVGGSTAGDIQLAGQTYSVDNKVNDVLGYRIGWEWDQHGSVTSFELGKMPTINLDPKLQGIAFSNIMNYARLTFHFWVFNGDRKYHLKEPKAK